MFSSLDYFLKQIAFNKNFYLNFFLPFRHEYIRM